MIGGGSLERVRPQPPRSRRRPTSKLPSQSCESIRPCPPPDQFILCSLRPPGAPLTNPSSLTPSCLGRGCAYSWGEVTLATVGQFSPSSPRRVHTVGVDHVYRLIIVRGSVANRDQTLVILTHVVVQSPVCYRTGKERKHLWIDLSNRRRVLSLPCSCSSSLLSIPPCLVQEGKTSNPAR